MLTIVLVLGALLCFAEVVDHHSDGVLSRRLFTR